MKPTVRDLYKAIDEAAPFDLAVPGDNSGILVGDPSQTVDAVLVALDVCTPVIRQAQALGCQLILAHHPVLMQPTRRLVCDDPDGQVVYRLAQAGLSLMAAHTNLDRAVGGVNDELARRLGWQAQPLGDFLRVGIMDQVHTPDSLAAYVRERVGGTPVWIGPADARIHAFAICGGSGGSEIALARSAGADVLITGEVKHSDALAALELGLCVLPIGHGASEICAVDLLQKHLQNAADALQWKLCVRVSTWQLLV